MRTGGCHDNMQQRRICGRSISPCGRREHRTLRVGGWIRLTLVFFNHPHCPRNRCSYLRADLFSRICFMCTGFQCCTSSLLAVTTILSFAHDHDLPCPHVGMNPLCVSLCVLWYVRFLFPWHPHLLSILNAEQASAVESGAPLPVLHLDVGKAGRCYCRRRRL